MAELCVLWFVHRKNGTAGTKLDCATEKKVKCQQKNLQCRFKTSIIVKYDLLNGDGHVLNIKQEFLLENAYC